MEGVLRRLPWHQPKNNNLSGREKEVLITIAEGLSGREAALKLHITLATLKAHKSRIRSKLDLHSIPSLVRYAIREELAQPWDLNQRYARGITVVH
jgi:DNA-binding NarL/FixJ family response regulator